MNKISGIVPKARRQGLNGTEFWEFAPLFWKA